MDHNKNKKANVTTVTPPNLLFIDICIVILTPKKQKLCSGYQCQETALGKGCTVKGVCGKTADVAGLQDLLIYLLKGISKLTVALRAEGKELPEANKVYY